MKLTPPFALSTIDNPFGNIGISAAVLAYYQKTLKIDGHPGDDFDIPWGTPIPNAIEGAVVSALLSKDNPNLMVFRAVNTIYDPQLPDGTCYEIQYGHVSTINVKVGQVLKLGDIVANVGNTGDVFRCKDGKCVEITADQKNAGSHLGSHLHFQVRVLKKMPATSANIAGVDYVNDGVGQLVLNGYKYEVPNYMNGYNGCIDPKQFFSDPAPVIVSDPTIPDTVKSEVEVLKTTTDPEIRQNFIKLIVAQLRAFLGW